MEEGKREGKVHGEESSDWWDRYLIWERRTFILLSIHGQPRLLARSIHTRMPVWVTARVTDRAWAGTEVVFKVVLICEHQLLMF